MRRAAVSVPSNIAEGYGRGKGGYFVNHLRMAAGSLREVETQRIIAGRHEFISRELGKPAWEALQDVGKMLHGLIKSQEPNSR